MNLNLALCLQAPYSCLQTMILRLTLFTFPVWKGQPVYRYLLCLPAFLNRFFFIVHGFMKCNIFIAEWWSLDFLYCYLQLFANKLFAPFFLCTVSSVAAATVVGLSCCCPAMTWADGIVKLCKLNFKELWLCWRAGCVLGPSQRKGWGAVLYQGKSLLWMAPPGEASVLTFVCTGLACPSFPFFIKK